MPYSVEITTENGSKIPTKIEELKELKELLLKFEQQKFIRVDIHKIKTKTK